MPLFKVLKGITQIAANHLGTLKLYPRRSPVAKEMSGFTLIELMIVITIISIVGSVGYFAINNALDKGRDKARKDDLRSLQSALTSYYQEKNSYPPSCAGVCLDGTILTSADLSDIWIPGLEDYVEEFPKDPKQAGITNIILAQIQSAPNQIASLFKETKENISDQGQVAAATTVKFPLLTNISNRTGGSVNWTNDNYVKASDNWYAERSLSSGQTSHYINAFSFGFTDSDIPAGSTIDGIMFSVEAKLSNGTSSLGVRPLKAGVVAGNTTANKALSTRESTQSYGNSVQKWGTTWTDADIKDSGFGAAIYAHSVTTNLTDYIDSVGVTVYYSPLSPPNLTVNSVTTDKSSYTPGEAMTLSVTVQNNSTENVSTSINIPWKHDLASDASTPNCNPGWNDYSIVGLNAGASDVHNIGPTAPTTPGTYKAAAFVDGTCNINESDEGDNYLASATYTIAAAPTPTPTPDPWIFCANEWDTCTFSGTKEVRFGIDGMYSYGTHTDSAWCHWSVFPDPAPGFAKQCWYDSTPAPTPTPTPTPSPSPTPSPTPSPEPSPGVGGTDPIPTSHPNYDQVPPPEATKVTANYNCDGLTAAVYCYITNAARDYFILWVDLDNYKDSESVWLTGTHCRRLPPAGTNFNFCLESQK